MISRQKLYDMYVHMNLNDVLKLKLDYWDLLYLFKLSLNTPYSSDTSSIVLKICDLKDIDSEKMDLITNYHSKLSNADIISESFIASVG